VDGGWREPFQTDPAQDGWKTFGDAALFHWSPTNENIAVTWDSSQTNSYYYRSIGATLDRRSSFSLSFDLQLNDITAGSEPGKPSTFELSLGLINFSEATQNGFWRGTGSSTPDLFEFDYFPDTGFGATIWPTVTSSNVDYLTLQYDIAPLQTGVLYHVAMDYSGVSNLLSSAVTVDGALYASIVSATPTNTAAGFTLDTFAIESYSSGGQNPDYAGSILAHGTIDNVVVAFPSVPAPSLTISYGTNGATINFYAQSNMVYTVERTIDFMSWMTLGQIAAPPTGRQSFADTNSPGSSAFYRVLATRN
jgi:hypothetical protein